MTFAAYATSGLAGLSDDAPDRARYGAALEHRLLPVLGAWPLLEDAAADLHAGAADLCAPVSNSRSRSESMSPGLGWSAAR